MSKLEVKQEHSTAIMEEFATNDIPVGEVFLGEINDHPSVYLRIHDRIVDLRRPSQTWTVETLKVTHYRPAQSAVLTVF